MRYQDIITLQQAYSQKLFPACLFIGESYPFELIIKRLYPSYDWVRFPSTFAKHLFVDEAYTSSLFASKKILWVDDIDKCNATQLQLLQEYVIQPATYPLCLTAKNFSNTHSLTEAIAQHGAICDLNRLKPWEKKDVMMAWVHSYVMQHKISITLDDIKYIAAAVDFDIRALISELHKMMSFVTTSTITRKQIDQILAAKHKNSLSEFTDMLLAFNVKQAYCIVDNLIDQGINITTCFFHVRAQLRIGIQMHQSLNPKKFLSQTYPGFSSSFIDKKLELFSSYGLNKLHQGVQECVALESLARRMNLSDRVVLELLIAKLV